MGNKVCHESYCCHIGYLVSYYRDVSMAHTCCSDAKVGSLAAVTPRSPDAEIELPTTVTAGKQAYCVNM